MKKHSSEFSIKWMARVLGVSPNGFHEFTNRDCSSRDKENQKILSEIKSISEESFGNYGSPRITAELKDRDFQVNHKRVESIMKNNDISAKKLKVFRVKTTDSNHDYPLSPDLV